MMMKITAVNTYPVKMPREVGAVVGTAGLPAPLMGEIARPQAASIASSYQWAQSYRTLYSTRIETLLVSIETNEGIIGWGEAQSPLAPEVVAATIETLLGPIIIGEDALAPEALWNRMYSAMRVRGHTGGFFVDAIAGIDMAIWDICGKAYDQPVCRLLGGPIRTTLPCYISGLPGADDREKLDYARAHFDQGSRCFKIFLDRSEAECLSLIDELRDSFADEIEIFVDALWRLLPKSALAFSRQLAQRNVGWLEAPLMPEDLEGHRRLTAKSRVPVAIGESYRTRFELLPFFEARALDIVQPDVGRTGITEGRKIASMADGFHVPIAPHISIGLGPQIAAALHLSAATTNMRVIECNPLVYEVANRFLDEPIDFTSSSLNVPSGPGLGIAPNLEAIQHFLV